MQSLLNRSIILAKQWGRAILVGMVLCGAITFVVATLMPKVYTAETMLVISMNVPPDTSAIQNALVMQPTFNELIKSDAVLQPVAARHSLTIAQLKAMMTTKAQPNTPIILVDINNGSPVLAAQLSYEVTNALVTYVNAQSGPLVQFTIIKPAIPVAPSSPRPMQDAFWGTLVGLGLALSTIVVFALINDRLQKKK